MSKKQTEVILTNHIVSLGKSEGDMVSVAPGYARNYLLPHGLAIPSSPGNQRRIASLQVQKVEREATELQHMTELRDSLKSLKLVIKVKVGEGKKLFGSVTAGTICDELKNQFDVDLDKRKVSLDKAIKEIGEYDVPLKLHADVEAELNVIVESEDENGDVIVRSRFHCAEYLRYEVRNFTGKYRHYLKHTDSGYLIALQRADLVNREGPYDYVLQWWL